MFLCKIMGNNAKQFNALYKNTLALYFMTAFKYLLPFLISACLTRRLSVECYGIVSYINSYMLFFLYIFDFGFNYSATKSISQNRTNIEFIQKKINQVMTCKILLVIIAFFAFIPISVFIPLLRKNIILALVFFFSQAANIFLPDFVYRGLEKMGFITIRYVIAKVISVALIFLVIKGDNDLLLLPIIYLGGTIAAVMFSISSMKCNMGLSLKFAPLKESLPELKESAVFFISSFASVVLGYFISFIMGIVDSVSTVDIAYWSVALQIVSAVQALFDPITSSLYPHVARNRDYQIVLRVSFIFEILVVFGCVALYFLSGFVVRLLAGDGYEVSAYLLKIFLPLLILSFPAQMLGFPLLGAMDHQKLVTLSTLISSFVQFALVVGLLFMGKFTLVTAAVTKIVSEFVLLFARMCFVVFTKKKKQLIDC